ncbi:hypothetical protein SBA4_1380001 [Candidatus Sulfopaludibacter sp. SbA4]|nr:hypothetical protein SBA4_1380001 [Candidatus Sulfopaludibacter sp. SbA4]
MPDSLMIRRFTISPGIVGPRSQLSPRQYLNRSDFLKVLRGDQYHLMQHFLRRKTTVRRGSVERNSLPKSILTDHVNSSYPVSGVYGRGDL